MISKKVLALMMGAIVASSGMSQMAVQVYAHDEELISSSKHMKDGSDAEKLYKLPNFKRESVERFLNRKPLEIEDLSNLYISPTSRLVFKPGLNQEAKLVGLAEKVNFIGNIVIPEKVSINGETYSVTSIGNAAFRGYRYIQLKSLPKSLKIIGKRAFFNCAKLKLGELPPNLREIGSNAFADCRNLELTELPTNLSKIGSFAFDHCSNVRLKSLPAQLSEIDKGAFYNTGIRTITIPASVTKLGDSAFDTYLIEKINVEQGSILKNDAIEKAYGKQLDRILDAAWQEQETTTQNEVNVENDGRECYICQWEFDEGYDAFVGTLPCGHGKYLEGFSNVEYDFRQGNMIFICPECGSGYYV